MESAAGPNICEACCESKLEGECLEVDSPSEIIVFLVSKRWQASLINLASRNNKSGESPVLDIPQHICKLRFPFWRIHVEMSKSRELLDLDIPRYTWKSQYSVRRMASEISDF